MTVSNNPPAPNPPGTPVNQPVHIDSTWVGTYFCGGCKAEIGTPDEISITETGGRGAVEAEAGKCPECERPFTHKRIVITEPV
jgi:hypothetical protein